MLNEYNNVHRRRRRHHPNPLVNPKQVQLDDLDDSDGSPRE